MFGHYKVVGVVLVMTTMVVSCALIDLRPIEISIYPGEAWAILPETTSSLSITLDTEVDQKAFEALWTVSSPDGTVNGDISWDGLVASWKPLEPWKPGVRYRLVLQGTIEALDGRTQALQWDEPFFAVVQGALPVLLSWDVRGTASAFWSNVATGLIDQTLLSLYFSTTMDAVSFLEDFTLNPSLDWTAEWSPDGTSVSIIQKSSLKALETYTWKIGPGTLSSLGQPLGRTWFGQITTMVDQVSPTVVGATGVLWNGTQWEESFSDLDQLSGSSGLQIKFSEAMDRESLDASCRISPSISGYWEYIDSQTLVFAPLEPWVPGTWYALTVKKEIKDTAGLPMFQDWTTRFLIPEDYLGIVSGNVNDLALGTTTFTPVESGLIVPLAITVVDNLDDVCTLELVFDGALTQVQKSTINSFVSCSPYFPQGLSSPSLQSITWSGDSAVTLTWHGMEPGSPTVPHFYELQIQGTASGFQDKDSRYFKDTLRLLVEAKKP